jgi:hypothetical protein
MADEELDADPGVVVEPYDRKDVDRVVEVIKAGDGTWGEGQVVGEGALKWRAHLSRGGDHLHVHLADELMPYMIDRLEATRAAGLRPHLALPLQSLCDDVLARQLVKIEPRVHVIDRLSKIADPEPLLVALGRRWRVDSEARKSIGLAAWDLVVSAGTNQEKGERLEALLCFLLGQVTDFDLSEHSLDTATEEIDIVVTIRANSGRCWVSDGSPFILVEAKNWHTQTVGQAEVSTFGFKISHKRGTVRIGLMVGATGFSPEAKDQTLRTSKENLTIALLGPEEMAKWIEADDGDSGLEDIVRRAMLY